MAENQPILFDSSEQVTPAPKKKKSNKPQETREAVIKRILSSSDVKEDDIERLGQGEKFDSILELLVRDQTRGQRVVPGKISMSNRVSQVGYSSHACAENIVCAAIKGTYQETARYLVEELWMNSPGHRKNILTPSYTHLGCGAAFYYNDQYRSVYVKSTQNFLKKR